MKSPKKRFLMTLLEIVLVLFALVVLFPLFFIFMNSVKTFSQVSLSMLSFPTELHFENFVIAFERMNYLSAFGNSILITAGSVCGLVLISSMAAYQVARKKCLASKLIFYGIVLVSMAIPFQALMIPLIIVAKNLGMVNSPIALVIMYWGFLLPMAMFLYHGFIQGVPHELEEASQIDGCGQIRSFFYIVFPILKSITATVVIINALTVFNDFTLPLIMLSSDNTRTIPLAMSVFSGTYMSEWNLTLAALTITIVPILIFFLFAQKHIMKGLADGALKG